MKIGYSVEGSTDRALIHGLVQRWCPGASLEEGSYRGSSGLSRRREIPKICLELWTKRVDVIIFLSDCNNEEWRSVLNDESGRVPENFKHLVIMGICERNVECWICADADWLARQIESDAEVFRVEDPKRPFEEALGITPRDRKMEEIAKLVLEAPLKSWLRNRSFEDFYDKVWTKSNELGCRMENIRKG